ncbi:SHOCT domain-containing protein [Nocardia huaxiensis]|uniref:PLDc N-terminal domain-containing protein n=1 Tax=Nocardia huaxiensis TaxID=2755382 RepID=A0A7D6VBY6_9NOCA|nr:SHOCT domain-containing protein [Nocardia huaxiensis]QLY29237.1 PLDc N-terminal domain-containing protein [Nocardia huaxiensis]UFS97262.1 PLDc N-terminal domain-containing protein [Nocardia huaxiensis]
MSFWEVLWLIIVSFAFVAYLLLLFHILGDLFRDTETSGWIKAIWVVFLIFLPLLTALVYLIVRGNGMQQRAAAEARHLQDAEAKYIRKTAGTNPAAQIADAGKLLDSGFISQQEFDQLKAKALS